MNFIEKTGKNVEEAVEAALADLGVGIKEVEYEVLEAPSKALFGFIGGKPAKVRVTLKTVKKMADSIHNGAAQNVNGAQEFLQNVCSAMTLNVNIEKLSNEDGVTLNIRGEDLGILIGKHGQTLDALQYLTNLAANRDGGERTRVTVDVEDYRKRRAETLANLALRLADKVRRRGEKVVLEPMTPHERKIIHMALQDDLQVMTYSEGEEPYRKVVIALKR